MSKRFVAVSKRVVAGLVLIATMVLVVGALSGGSASGRLSSGRSVNAQSDSWYLKCNFAADTATIETAGRTIVVAPDQLLVDGRALAAMDATTRSVNVSVRGNAITFVADGKTIASCPR